MILVCNVFIVILIVNLLVENEKKIYELNEFSHIIQLNPDAKELTQKEYEMKWQQLGQRFENKKKTSLIVFFQSKF